MRKEENMKKYKEQVRRTMTINRTGTTADLRVREKRREKETLYCRRTRTGQTILYVLPQNIKVSFVLTTKWLWPSNGPFHFR